jgi:glycosyltransferase involved in cell wall biosynthesis
MQSDCFQAIADSSVSSIQFFRYPGSVLVESHPHPYCRACIIVPVRNEAVHLKKSLNALAQQVDLQGKRLDPSTYEVIVLANNCIDDSADIARQFAQQYPDFALHVVEKTFEPAEAYIGRVRQILMDEAYRRLISLGQNQGVIASTDGDTQVSPTWLAAIQHEISLGAEGVSGRIMTSLSDRSYLDPYTRACYLRAVGYGYLCVELESHIDPDPFDCLPRHHQHCGASLAVTAEIYAKAGGMPPVKTPEDVAFYRSLRRVGARFRHSPLVWVKTSARQQGRTANGMANQLSAWSALGHKQQAYLVEPAIAVETRFRVRRQLRELWQRQQTSLASELKSRSELRNQLRIEIRQLAKLLCVDEEWLSCELAQPSFGILHERIEAHQVELGWERQWQLVPIEQAMADLKARISALRTGVY